MCIRDSSVGAKSKQSRRSLFLNSDAPTKVTAFVPKICTYTSKFDNSLNSLMAYSWSLPTPLKIYLKGKAQRIPNIK